LRSHRRALRCGGRARGSWLRDPRPPHGRRDAVHADLERADGATDVEHFEQAVAIIWDHLDDEAQQAEIRLRSPDDTDEIVTYSTAELEEIHQRDGT
jgi:hypothetical protein